MLPKNHDSRRGREVPTGLVILGFGGHARSVADVALAAGVTQLRFVDENAQPGERFLDFPVSADWAGDLQDGWSVFPAAGSNERRKEQMESMREAGQRLATLIAPTANLGVGSTIDEGTLVAHHAHVGPMARIGAGCIINTGALVDHEAAVGDFTHVSVNTTICGRSKVGCLSFIGTGATVIDQVEVADRVTIGAGGVVTQSIMEAGVYVGVPVRRVVTRLDR